MNLTLTTTELASAGVILFALLMLIAALRRLRGSEASRHARLFKRKEWQQAVSTESPLDHPRREASSVAVESLKSRFTIIRRLIVAIFVLVVLIIGSLPFLGTLPTALVSLFVAAASVVIGIAARPFLENFIAGVVLTFGKPFRVGDTVFIDETYYGTVEDITMTHTIIKIWDWRRFVVPNSEMMNKNFLNYTLKDRYIWSYVEFRVAPDTDLDVVREEAVKAARESAAFAGYEEPEMWVMGMEEKAIKCWIAAWVDSPSDAWQLNSDIREQLSKKFASLKITPHRHSLDLTSGPLPHAPPPGQKS